MAFDLKQTVILFGALSAAGRSRFYKRCSRCDRKVGYKGVSRFTRAVRHHPFIASRCRRLHHIKRFGERAYLVRLYQNRVSRSLSYSPVQALGIGHEQVVSDQHDPA